MKNDSDIGQCGVEYSKPTCFLSDYGVTFFSIAQLIET